MHSILWLILFDDIMIAALNSNVHELLYVALHAPSLHVNNSESGTKEGNISVSTDFTTKNIIQYKHDYPE